MKKKNFLVYTLIKVSIILLFTGLMFANIFEMLDFRFYDSMMHWREEPKQNENIILVKIDDNSINTLQSEWPWTRDIIANSLLRLKEFGADTAIFDIEYISPSSNGIAPAAEEKIQDNITLTESNVADLIGQLSSAAASGMYAPEEIPILANSLIDYEIRDSFSQLLDFVANNISRDNDEYFAQSLQFFGKSYLTINQYDMGYPVTDDEMKYIQDRFLFDTVDDPKNKIHIGNNETAGVAYANLGITPALHKLLTRAYNVSFTNSVVDSDGVRRRMELLYEYNGKFLPQLVFGPYLDIVGSRKIIREKDFIIVKDALIPGTTERRELKIPVDRYGRLLINWRRGNIDESFKTESIVNILNLDKQEKTMINCLNNIAIQSVLDADGFEMESTLATYDLIDFYMQLEDYKTMLLSECQGYDAEGNVIGEISQEEYNDYFAARKQFYDAIGNYINQGYLDVILTRINEILPLVEGEDKEYLNSFVTYLPEDFSVLEEEYKHFCAEIDRFNFKFKDSYCIIGNTATSTTDNGATPFEEKFMNVGIHANILNTLLTEDFIYVLRWPVCFCLAVVIALLMLLISNKSSGAQNAIAAVSYALFTLIFIIIFVQFDYYVPIIGSIMYLTADLIAGIALRFYYSTMEKKFITQIAASFANKDTVDELRRNPDAFKTEGQKKVITALFSDIQKFSTLSESIGKIYGSEGPNKLIEILNEYLGDMSNEILKNNGTIDKYEGDAIISMFGAPDPLGSHTKEEWAYLCLDSAVHMKEVELEFNKTHGDLFVPREIERNGQKETVILKPLQTRIGVNSGEAFVGLMGSKTEAFSKLNYTMIGDTVNLASRLEGVNKAYNTWIMCSDDTWNLANSGENKGKLVARKLDRVRVVGRSTPVQLYNILGFRKDISSEQIEQIEIFHEALAKYLNRDFIHAGKLFLQANQLLDGDPTAVLYAKLCKEYIDNGIPEGWDGVRTMDSK